MTPRRVEHFRLDPYSDEANKLGSICPDCKEGLLLCMRDPVTFVLQECDCCTLCGLMVSYIDIEEMRAKDRAKR